MGTEWFHKKCMPIPMKNLKTVTGSLSIVDYRTEMYRCYSFTSCLPEYYDKMLITGTCES